MKTISLTMIIFLAAQLACAKKDDTKTSNVTTSMRSTGTISLGSSTTPLSLAMADVFLANSDVTVSSFKIPIGRINLTAGDSGSGYTEASPNFYTCPGTTNEECLVDVVSTSISDLLTASAAAATGDGTTQAIEFADTKTYTGTAVELCAEGLGGSGSTFKAKLKASAMLGDTTYYTNADSATGVSTTAPATEVEIEMPCMGRNTTLLEPITVEPGATIDLVFWAEPAGSILVANNAKLINSSCTDDGTTEVAFCASLPAFFGTTVAGSATAKKYLLDVTTPPTTAPSGSYADMLATVVYNAGGDSIGATLKQVYTNTAGEEKLMHAPNFALNAVSESSGKITLSYGIPTTVALITDMPATGSGTGLTISELVTEEVSFNSRAL